MDKHTGLHGDSTLGSKLGKTLYARKKTGNWQRYVAHPEWYIYINHSVEYSKKVTKE